MKTLRRLLAALRSFNAEWDQVARAARAEILN